MGCEIQRKLPQFFTRYFLSLAYVIDAGWCCRLLSFEHVVCLPTSSILQNLSSSFCLFSKLPAGLLYWKPIEPPLSSHTEEGLGQTASFPRYLTCLHIGQFTSSPPSIFSVCASQFTYCCILLFNFNWFRVMLVVGFKLFSRAQRVHESLLILLRVLTFHRHVKSFTVLCSFFQMEGF